MINQAAPPRTTTDKVVIDNVFDEPIDLQSDRLIKHIEADLANLTTMQQKLESQEFRLAGSGMSTALHWLKSRKVKRQNQDKWLTSNKHDSGII